MSQLALAHSINALTKHHVIIGKLVDINYDFSFILGEGLVLIEMQNSLTMMVLMIPQTPQMKT